jgi:transcriptional regulator
MFVPCHYREPDESWIVDLVRNNPLATLISNGAETNAPYATHVPIILDPLAADQSPADLSAVTLWGHMNRTNPHWRALLSDTAVALIFTGPHGYVSPTVYQINPAAPTWNFAAVHVRGVLRKIESDEPGEETLETVASTVRTFEGDFGTGWCMSDSIGYFRRILPGVGAFRIEVSDVDGMFKLSQEQETTVRRRVQLSFAQRESANHQAIAAMMSRLPSAQ